MSSEPQASAKLDRRYPEAAIPPRRDSKRILYMTFEGVLEPLGRSQVLRYLFGLIECGFSYDLISLERERDLVDTAVVTETERLLRQHGVEWIWLPYRQGSAKAVLENIRAMTGAARQLIRNKNIGLVHARAHVPALIAWYLRLRTRVPYLFDARGYWIDEKVAEGLWFTRPSTYAIAKRLERWMFRSAAAVVTLTGVMANDLRSSTLRDKPSIPIEVIPTCADFEEFSLDSKSLNLVPEEIRRRLEGKLVIGIIGSINASYYIQEGVALFCFLRQLRPDAHLLFVTRQREWAQELVKAVGLSDDDCTIAQARHQDMPGWLLLMDWGLLLLKETFAKRGSMPTKLAEMLACGVRPIQYGCNSEVREKVREAGSGIILPDVSEVTLRCAAGQIASTALNSEPLQRARQISRDWFSAESGIKKYESLLARSLDGLRF